MGTSKSKITSLVSRHWPIITLLVVWLIFSHPYFFKGLVPFPARYLVDFFAPWSGFYGMPVKNQAMPDVITQLYPWKKIVIDSWRQFQVPAWNPYQFGGYPLLGNVQSAAWTPLNVLFFILPFLEAWSMLILLQPIAAGVGMYLFTRTLGLSRLAAVLSSISFMFCGFMTVWMAYGTLGYAALTLPWILWSLTKLIGGTDWKWILVTSALVAFSLFSGHIQTSAYVVGSALLFIIAWRRNLKKALFALSLGLVISVPQLIPTIRFYDQSVRSELFQKIEVIPWNYLPTILSPDILGNPVTRNDWFGHYAEWASFAGVIPLVLALLAVCAPIKKRRMIWMFTILGGISLLLAYQTPILDFVVSLKIPVLSTSAASRVIVLLSFSIAVLSGFGFDLIQIVWERYRRYVLIYSAWWLGILVFMWSMIAWGNLFWIPSVDAEKLHVAARNFIFPTLLVLCGVGVLIAGLMKRKNVRQVLLILLLVVTSFDMLRYTSKWIPFEEREYVYPDIPVLTFLLKEKGFERVFGNFGNEAQSVFGLFGIEGYDPLYIRRFGEFISASGDGRIRSLERTTVLIDRQGKYTKRILDLLSVRLILHAKGDERNVWAFPYWSHPNISQTPMYSDEQYEVYKNEGALPRAYFVGSFVLATNDQDLLDLLLSASTDVRATVILEEEPAGFEKKSASGELFERIRIERYTPNVIEISAQTNQAGLLVLTDPYYAGWTAFVNGKKTKIYRANYVLRAIVVPEGISNVRFVYDHWFL